MKYLSDRIFSNTDVFEWLSRKRDVGRLSVNDILELSCFIRDMYNIEINNIDALIFDTREMSIIIIGYDILKNNRRHLNKKQMLKLNNDLNEFYLFRVVSYNLSYIDVRIK